MVFYMPGEVEPQALQNAEDKTPREIVQELNRYIVGQQDAKRAVAIALRNRYRRRQLPPEIAAEIMPKNLLMIGPTGVGKTEIARRLAKLANAPFLKLEASKFTEVGYVGRDVESMIRDLVEIGVELERSEKRREAAPLAREAVERRLLDLLLPPRPEPGPALDDEARRRAEEQLRSYKRSREVIERKLRAGELEQKVIEVEVTSPSGGGFTMMTPNGFEEMDFNIKEMMPGLFPKEKRKRKMTVEEAREVLQREEEDLRIDEDAIGRDGVKRVESSGIIFLDEMDKIAGRDTAGGNADVSREGVQRDLLPIVEGTLVKTKYGMVRTDHILFIGAGAFHVSKPSDLMPELQGRFPIRVELAALRKEEFVRILTEPEFSLTRQYTELLKTEGIEIQFTEDGIEQIAEIAEDVNRRHENIGARRLHTLLERILEEASFEGPDLSPKQIEVNGEFVSVKLKDIVQDMDLSKYVL